MIKNTLQWATLSATLIFHTTVFAQPPQSPMPFGNKHTWNEHMMHHGTDQSGYPPRNYPNRPPLPRFPTIEELDRLSPPEPMTEEKIKERFAAQKARITESIERDREAAKKYAEDFARMQKHQADRLAELMDKAEKRRGEILTRIDEQEQRALIYFRGRNAANNDESAPAPAAPAE